jgi:DNA-binding ferritin-like protein
VLLLYTKNAQLTLECGAHDFQGKHLFFEKRYGELPEVIDEIAACIRSVGHYAPAIPSDFLKLLHVTEKSRDGWINLLLADRESIISLRY